MANRLVIATRGGVEQLPDWLLHQIADERFLVCVCRSKGKKVPGGEEIGDAETFAYLLTASSSFPLREPLSTIFAYLARRVLQRRGWASKIPSELRVKRLTEIETRELRNLKSQLCQVRGQITHPVVEAVEEVAKSLGSRAHAAAEEPTKR